MHLFIKNLTRLSTVAATASALLGIPAGAYAANATATATTITVIDPYIRLAPPAARVTAAFMVLRNNGTSELRLIGVDNAAAKITELHEHTNDDGVMKMRQVKAITIPAGGEAILQPGGMHVMLIDLLVPLKSGDSIPATLRFDNGSSQAINLPVRPSAATAPQHHH